MLKATVKKHKRIIFNGNGYSADWQKEAGKRGLLNLKNTVDALPEIMKPPVIKAFEQFKVLTEAELHARYEINLETYCKTINIEAQLMVLMANRYILPAAFEYQKHVGQSVAAAKAGGAPSKEGRKHLSRLVKLIDAFKAQTDKRRSAGGSRQPERREAREVHARHDGAGDGEAARPRRSAGADDPARDVAVADLSGDAVCEVRSSGL